MPGPKGAAGTRWNTLRWGPSASAPAALSCASSAPFLLFLCFFAFSFLNDSFQANCLHLFWRQTEMAVVLEHHLAEFPLQFMVTDGTLREV